MSIFIKSRVLTKTAGHFPFVQVANPQRWDSHFRNEPPKRGGSQPLLTLRKHWASKIMNWNKYFISGTSDSIASIDTFLLTTLFEITCYYGCTNGIASLLEAWRNRLSVKPLLHVETFSWNLGATAPRTSFTKWCYTVKFSFFSSLLSLRPLQK